MSANILLIDDEAVFYTSVIDAFGDSGFNVEHAATWEEGVKLFRVGMHNLVIADFDLAGVRDGLLLLAKLKGLRQGTRLLLISGKAVTVAPEKVESTKVVDRFIVKGSHLMEELLAEAAQSEDWSNNVTDWNRVAEGYVAASEVDSANLKEVDDLMRRAMGA